MPQSKGVDKLPAATYRNNTICNNGYLDIPPMQKTDAQIAEICQRLKVLSNKARMSIVLLFLDGKERTVNEIADNLGIAQSTASEQLKKIKEQSNFISSRKEGKEVYYFPNREEVLGFVELINDYFKNCC